MFEGLKDAFSAKPAQGFSVSIGFWLLASVLIFLPKELQYMVSIGQPILVVGAIGYMIPALKGIPDLVKAIAQTTERKEIIRNLDVAAKDALWSMLTNNRRTFEVEHAPTILKDHRIIVFLGGGMGGFFRYRISDEYWPILHKEGETLLYEGKHKPSNPWPKD